MNQHGNGTVAVIIVNYGTSKLVMRAVESILSKDHGGRRVEIHVVDNASPGTDAILLQNAIAKRGWAKRGVTLLLENENHGFGKGNNLVLRKLASRMQPPEFVLLLNSDAWLDNEAIEILADALDADTQAAGAGARIVDETGTPVVCAFRFPTMISEITANLGIGPIYRYLAHWQVPLPPEYDGEVDWVAGASVLFRLSALESVEFFDPSFFLYYEEVDLMRRLASQGRHMVLAKDARVFHIAGSSTKIKNGRREKQRSPHYLYESWRIYFHRQHGRGYTLTTALLVIIAAIVHNLVAALRGKPANLAPNFIVDKWRFVIWPLLTQRHLRHQK